jgi:hypothetical protein
MRRHRNAPGLAERAPDQGALGEDLTLRIDGEGQ